MRQGDGSADPLQAQLIEMLVSKLIGLDRTETELLIKNFERIWRSFYDDLRASVCAATESDYYGWPKREPRRPRAEYRRLPRATVAG